jgi:HK97 family phage prohead protease
MPTIATNKRFLTTSTAQAGSKDEPSMIVTSPDPDRDGDRIMPSGMRAENFLKNSPLLFGHDHRALPVGTVTSLNQQDHHVVASWRWLENDEFADRVKNAWEQGVLRAASIGFRPLRSVPNDFGGQDILEWELYEISLVPIPANPAAVRTLKQLGLLGTNTQKTGERCYACGNGDVLELRDDSLALEIIEPVTHVELQDFIDIDDTKSLNKAIGSVFAREFSGFLAKEVSTSLRDAIDYARGRVR